MMSVRHTFAVCAYGQSPYLKECLDSLKAQTNERSDIFIATSTPSKWLDDLASLYGVRVVVNEGESGIGQDWSFAYSCANTPFVTIAHQDDVYSPDYAASAVSSLLSDQRSLIYFCDYGEIREDKIVDKNSLLFIKRILLSPLKNPNNSASRTAKRAVLRFGSAICCPAVTYNVENCPNPPFVIGMKSNLDWATWERLSNLEGSFLYDADRILMHHRIHLGSATSELIADKSRDVEDLEMLKRFWPDTVAKVIEMIYARGTKSNEL